MINFFPKESNLVIELETDQENFGTVMKICESKSEQLNAIVGQEYSGRVVFQVIEI